jgi:HlyD family secretion protein
MCVGLARLMPRGDVSVVAAPYGAGDARVAEILLAEGDGWTRAPFWRCWTIGTALESAVLMAEANLAVREATLMQTRAPFRGQPGRGAGGAGPGGGRGRGRGDSSAHGGAVSRGVSRPRPRWMPRTAREPAQAAVARAEATLARFSAIALEDQPDVVVADRNVEAAEAELARARLDLAAPSRGAHQRGRFWTSTPPPASARLQEGIMEMGDTGQMMAEVEIWQDRIAPWPGPAGRTGGRCTGRTLQGRVDSIGLTVGRQGLISDDTAAKTDARVIRVWWRWMRIIASRRASPTSRSSPASTPSNARPGHEPASAGLFGRLPIGWLQLTHKPRALPPRWRAWPSPMCWSSCSWAS